MQTQGDVFAQDIRPEGQLIAGGESIGIVSGLALSHWLSSVEFEMAQARKSEWVKARHPPMLVPRRLFCPSADYYDRDTSRD
jgi:hypothetical protein